MKDCIIEINGTPIKCKKETKRVLGLEIPIRKTIYLLNGDYLYKDLPNIVEINGKKYYKPDKIELNGDFKLIEI